jgi:putative ABC transport system permease protein
MPGVSSAALALTVPFYSQLSSNLFDVSRDSVVHSGRFRLQAGSPNLFRTVGTRVIRGRSFPDVDRAGAPPVMLVSEAMAKTLWPGRDAIGQCLTEGTKQSSLSDDPGLQFYVPLAQFHPEGALLFVRVEDDAGRFAETVRRRLQRLMPGASFVTVTPMRDIVDPQVRSWQIGATMFVAFGVLALMLAAVGLYSVIAYGVTQRTREIGLRMALGARTPGVLWLVLRDGVRFAVLGVVVGGAIALAVGRSVEPLLFNERASDPVVFLVVTGVLVVTVVGASILPARRAAKVDPSVAMRAD